VADSRKYWLGFELGNLVILNRQNMKTPLLARKFEYWICGLFKILEIICPTVIGLCLHKMWQMHQFFYISLIEPVIKGNWDVDLYDILKPSNSIENTPEYDVDKVTCLTPNSGKVAYLVNRKGRLETKPRTRKHFKNCLSVCAKEELGVIH
jgi:hypothetical protein